MYNPSIVAWQRLGKNLLFLLGNGSVKYYLGNEYRRNNRRTVGLVFCAILIVSRELAE
jgi:hypothetical protein